MCVDDQHIDDIWKSIELEDGAYRCYCTVYDSHNVVIGTQIRGWIYISGGNTRCDFVFTDAPLSLTQVTWALIKAVIE